MPSACKHLRTCIAKNRRSLLKILLWRLVIKKTLSVTAQYETLFGDIHHCNYSHLITLRRQAFYVDVGRLMRNTEKHLCLFNELLVLCTSN
jgi:hypothetical protein